MTAEPQSRSGRIAGNDACDPWKFWMTTLWTAAAIAAWAVVQLVTFVLVLAWLGVTDEATPQEVETFASHAVVISLIAVLAAPAEIGVVALAIRLARCRFADYLALVWPQRRHLLIGLVLILILVSLGDLSSYLSGNPVIPPFVVEAYRSGRDSGTLPLLVVALAVAAPLAEEIVFRGFVFRGFAASAVGVAGAIVIPSAIWAVMHVQYETFYIVQIFLLGIVFGWLRWRTGSLWLTIVLHALINLASLVQTAIFVEWLS